MARECDRGALPTNWRDVGLALRLQIGAKEIPSGRLLRSGQINSQHRRSVLGRPNTIVNLRYSDDEREVDRDSTEWAGARFVHIPAANSLEKYETSNRDVAAWLRRILLAVQEAVPPVLLHCRSGKDRTGVAVAAILVAVGLPDHCIEEEYALSTGPGVEMNLIRMSLSGLRERKDWKRGVDTARLRAVVCGEFDPSTQQSARSELAYINEQIKRLAVLLPNQTMRSPSHAAQDERGLPAVCNAIVDYAARKIEILRCSIQTEPSPGKAKGICMASSQQAIAYQNMGKYVETLRSLDVAIDYGDQSEGMVDEAKLRWLVKERSRCNECV